MLLAATNRPEIIDPALLRAGRFDRQVFVDRPDKASRLTILNVHIRKIRTAPDVDKEKIAARRARGNLVYEEERPAFLGAQPLERRPRSYSEQTAPCARSSTRHLKERWTSLPAIDTFWNHLHGG